MTTATQEPELITLMPTRAPGADWSIDAVPQPNGIALVLTFPLNGAPITVRLRMDRADARILSDGILKASGDGTQRSFPHPPAEGGDHGWRP